jgi:mRNA interferase MazF
VAKFIKGDVVVVPFPFSDLSAAKRRPALVISTLEGDDVILCQITSQALKDRYAIALDDNDFQSGGLKQPSNIRPNRLFTADSHMILYPIGTLRPQKLEAILSKVVEIIRQ